MPMTNIIFMNIPILYDSYLELASNKKNNKITVGTTSQRAYLAAGRIKVLC